jgi:hypothetical protein
MGHAPSAAEAVQTGAHPRQPAHQLQQRAWDVRHHLTRRVKLSSPCPTWRACGRAGAPAALAAAAAAELPPGVLPVDMATYTPSPMEGPGWEIWAGFVAGVFPFALGAYEFGKRIVSGWGQSGHRWLAPPVAHGSAAPPLPAPQRPRWEALLWSLDAGASRHTPPPAPEAGRAACLPRCPLPRS